MRHIYQYIALATLVLTALASCDNGDDCPINNTALSHYAFYMKSDSSIVKAQLQDTLTVRAIGTDSILINLLLHASELELPMSYYNEADTLVFEYINDGVRGRDTICISKSNMPHYESPDCPTAMFHCITAATSTHHAIDTVMIANPLVTYDVLYENIQVYFASPAE